jgi:hypothetical protein
VRGTLATTAIQSMQSERATYQSMSQTKADIAGGGFAASGSGLDIMAQSASQGALQQAVIQRQGLITEQDMRRRRRATATWRPRPIWLRLRRRRPRVERNGVPR